MDKTALDRYITKGPDNSYQEWYEKVFDGISERDITGDEYDQYEQFFDDGMSRLSLAGGNQPPVMDFVRSVIIRRFKILKENPHLGTWEEVQRFINQRTY